MASRGLRVVGLVGRVVLRALWLSLMVLTPLFGFWLASSLAAYLNATQWLALVIGLLLFPIVPVGWDLFYLWRRSKQPPAKQILTRADRLVLRTLLVNGLFLAAMFYWQPRTSFRALAVRGDWILDGHHGAIATPIRSALLGLADTFERRWHRGANEYGPSDKGPDTPVVEDAPRAEWPMSPEIDLQISGMPADAQTSPEAVGAYLAARITEPRRLAKAVHDYIALRLAYDYTSLAKIEAKDYATVPSQDAATVFASRTGVCEGYARMFVAIGKAAGLDVAYLTGYARDSQLQPPPAGSDPAAEALRSLEGYAHAWNAVKLDGRWELVDVTWDDPKDPAEPIRTTYLFTPPAAFGFQHLPENPAWQLVGTPVSPGEFVRRPLLTPVAEELGLSLLSPTRSQVDTDGELALLVANPRGAELVAVFAPPGSKDEAAQRDCTDRPLDSGQTHVVCALPDGEWEVLLFGAPAGATRLRYIGSIQVNAR